MISADAVSEILSLYQKHGWSLRRVLLSEKLNESLTASFKTLFGDAEIVPAEIDAAFFSRASGEREAWELRHLSKTPFAIFESFDKDIPQEVLREKLLEMVERLKKRLLSPE
jgi:hypothetical protein